MFSQVETLLSGEYIATVKGVNSLFGKYLRVLQESCVFIQSLLSGRCAV